MHSDRLNPVQTRQPHYRPFQRRIRHLTERVSKSSRSGEPPIFLIASLVGKPCLHLDARRRATRRSLEEEKKVRAGDGMKDRPRDQRRRRSEEAMSPSEARSDSVCNLLGGTPEDPHGSRKATWQRSDDGRGTADDEAGGRWGRELPSDAFVEPQQYDSSMLRMLFVMTKTIYNGPKTRDLPLNRCRASRLEGISKAGDSRLSNV